MPPAQWMTLGCYGKVVSDHAVKPHTKIFLLNPSCHVPSTRLSIPRLEKLFLSQYPCLNILRPQDAWLQMLPWTTGLFVLGPSLICHIKPLLIPGSSFTYTHLGHFPDCPIYLPRIPSSKIWVSLINFWSSSFSGKKKTHFSYFAVFLLLLHLFPFLQTKDILVFQSKATESYEQNNLFSPSIILRKAWNILMQRFSWRQKLAWKNSSQTARVWLSYK